MARKRATPPFREMTFEETVKALELYNRFAAEWTRREKDRSMPLPCSSQDWCEVHILDCMRSKLEFQTKAEPRIRYRLILKPRTKIWGDGWSFARPQIKLERVRRGQIWTSPPAWPRP